MTGIQDLAPETLANVFRLMGEPRSKERAKGLQAAALVCDAWRNPAQQELWDSIELDKRRGQIRKFELSRANQRRMRTRQVKVVGLGGDEQTLLGLVPYWVGVEKLELKGEKEYSRSDSIGGGSEDDYDDYDEGGRRVPVFPAAVLGHFSLDKLKELSISNFQCYNLGLVGRFLRNAGQTIQIPPMKIHFQLIKLSIESQLYSSHLLSLFQPTITSLTLNFSSTSNGDTVEEFLSAAESIASNVKEVKFINLESLRSTMAQSLSGSLLTDRLKTFWARFTNVVSLECDFGSLAYLKDSPPTLKYLEVYENEKAADAKSWEEDDIDLYEALRKWVEYEEAFHALVDNQSSLKMIRLEFFSGIESEEFEGFDSLRVLCQKKGIAFRSKRLRVW